MPDASPDRTRTLAAAARGGNGAERGGRRRDRGARCLLPHRAVALCVIATLGGCSGERAPTEVSARPEALDAGTVATTVARPGRLALRARIAYTDIETIIADALPESRPERGSRRLCRRIVGVRLCGTARWDILLTRTVDPVLAAAGDRLSMTLPLRFDGEVGVDGRVARALGLATLDVHGALIATARFELDLDERWCPRIGVEVEHDWSERPELAWAGIVDFDLRSPLDEALASRLATLGERLNAAIDCADFRARLAEHWRGYHIPLSLPGAPDVWLNVEPTGFGFSGIRPGPVALDFGMALTASAVIDTTTPAPDAGERTPLPPLERLEQTATRTRFDLIIRAGYASLDAVAIPALVGRSFEATSAAGPVRVDITSIAFSGNPAGVTAAIGFEADLPVTWRATHGVLYLSARPVVDTETERVSLTEVRLSPVLDNRLWSLVGGIFERQIIDVIENRAVLDLGERTAALETSIVNQLADPARTGGLGIEAHAVDIRLIELVAERDALAAVARVDAELDIDVPLHVLVRPLGR